MDENAATAAAATVAVAEALLTDKTPVNVVAATKKPPPESPHNIRVRRLVIFSFWAIVLFLGLPIWWRTTAIHRASLPLAEMVDWADGKVSPLA